MISRKLYATKDYIGWLLHNSPYYIEEDDKISYYHVSKDGVIIILLIRLLIVLLRETYDWYLSFKYHIKEIKQCRNKVKKN